MQGRAGTRRARGSRGWSCAASLPPPPAPPRGCVGPLQDPALPPARGQALVTLGQPCQQQQQEEEKPQAQLQLLWGRKRAAPPPRTPSPQCQQGPGGLLSLTPGSPAGGCGVRGDPMCQAVTRRQEASQHDTGGLCAVPPPSAASAPGHPAARGPPGSEHSAREQQQQRTHHPPCAQHQAQSHHHHHHHAGVPMASFQPLPTLWPCSPLPCALRTMVGGTPGAGCAAAARSSSQGRGHLPAPRRPG